MCDLDAGPAHGRRQSSASKLPQFRVATLPASSVNHGAMIDMMLRHNECDFGILDHDFYLFDRTVLQQLHFSDAEFLLCLLVESGRR